MNLEQLLEEHGLYNLVKTVLYMLHCRREWKILILLYFYQISNFIELWFLVFKIIT